MNIETKEHTLDVVAGAQFGSEAKGHLVQDLVTRHLEKRKSNRVYNIRVAGPNAGHTGYDEKGREWAFRSLPVGAVVPGRVTLVIAPGSEIDVEVLKSELQQAQEAGLMAEKTLVIAGEATVLDDSHKQTEARESLSNKLGSTGKGIGACRADRIMRSASRLQDTEFADEFRAMGAKVYSAQEYLTFINLITRPAAETSVVIEGTQGYGLGLHAGRYPKCTSSDTRAVDFMAMAGINPYNYHSSEVILWLVTRVYPIRVAGNSGEIRNETTWEELGLPAEVTTVTKKTRRVGMPDWDLVNEAVQANGRSRVILALSTLDQKFPEVAGATSLDHLSYKHDTFLDHVVYSAGASIGWIGTGPNSNIWVEGIR